MDDESCPEIPFNPKGTINRVQVIGPVRHVHSATAAELVFKSNPRRLWLLVTWEGPSTITRLLPFQTASSAGIGEITNSGYILIHNASVPGLVQGEWYAHENLGRILYLWEGQVYE